MRTRFDNELKGLSQELIKMGGLCEEVIETAIKSIITRDETLVNKSIELERMIDQKETLIETICMRLLVLQQPIASDLRVISSALKMITDMERIGDQARDIAELSKYIDLTSIEKNVKFMNMSQSVIDMVKMAVDAFIKCDVAMAKQVIDADDYIDELFREVKAQVIALIIEHKEEAEKYLDVMMVAKYLERIGDHATNIAEWVEYSVTGVHKE